VARLWVVLHREFRAAERRVRRSQKTGKSGSHAVAESFSRRRLQIARIRRIRPTWPDRTDALRWPPEPPSRSPALHRIPTMYVHIDQSPFA
jgi:hypothetical protein